MNAALGAPKVALITGASRGIGAGLVGGYRNAGYAVAGVARSVSPCGDEPGCLAVQADITDAAAAQRLVDQVLDHFGRIDTLVNNSAANRTAWSASHRGRREEVDE